MRGRKLFRSDGALTAVAILAKNLTKFDPLKQKLNKVDASDFTI